MMKAQCERCGVSAILSAHTAGEQITISQASALICPFAKAQPKPDMAIHDCPDLKTAIAQRNAAASPTPPPSELGA